MANVSQKNFMTLGLLLTFHATVSFRWKGLEEQGQSDILRWKPPVKNKYLEQILHCPEIHMLIKFLKLDNHQKTELDHLYWEENIAKQNLFRIAL